MTRQNRPDNLPLHSNAAAMDDADLPESFCQSLVEVLFHDDCDFLRQKRMQVDGILNRHFVHPVSIMVGL